MTGSRPIGTLRPGETGVMSIHAAPRSGVLHHALTPLATTLALAALLTGCSGNGGGSNDAPTSAPTSSPTMESNLPAPAAGRAYADATVGLALDEAARKRPLACELIDAAGRAALARKDLPALTAQTTTNQWDCSYTPTLGDDSATLSVSVRPAMDAGSDVYAFLQAAGKDEARPAAERARYQALGQPLTQGSLTSPKVCAAIAGARAVSGTPITAGAAGSSLADSALTMDIKGKSTHRIACSGGYVLSMKMSPAAEDAVATTQFGTAAGRFAADVAPGLPAGS